MTQIDMAGRLAGWPDGWGQVLARMACREGAPRPGRATTAVF